MKKSRITEPHISGILIQEDCSPAFLLKGVLHRAGASNQNKRRYPKEILQRECRKYEELVRSGIAFGEIGHPDSPVVNLDNVSHRVREIWWEGDDLWGTVELLATPSGKVLRELYKNNIHLGMSSRGLGSVKELHDGTAMVEEDFELICWDFVAIPSTPGAFMAPVQEFTRSVEWKVQAGTEVISVTKDQKKKFFNAVDKAYKAKSKGKLNEDWSAILSNPIALLFLGKIIWYFISYVGLEILHKKYKKEDDWALNYLIRQVANDSKAMSDIANEIGRKKKVEVARIAKIPSVARLIQQATVKTNKKFGNIMNPDLLGVYFGNELWSAWNNDSIRNSIIDKVRQDIKNTIK